jgi:hypothetical protein
MKNFIGNCSSVIDCEALIAACELVEGNTILAPLEINKDDVFYKEESKETFDLLETVYKNVTSVKFKHYYPGQHFDQKIVDELGKFCGVEPLGSFVSKVEPGFCVPLHKDIMNNYKDLYLKNKLQRFVIFLSKPSFGAGFILEDEIFYLEEQGNTYKFPDPHSWHAGFNVGTKSKHLITFTGFLP